MLNNGVLPAGGQNSVPGEYETKVNVARTPSGGNFSAG